MVEAGSFQNQKKPVMRRIDFARDHIGAIRLKVMGLAEIVEQVGSPGVAVQHGEAAKRLGGLGGAPDEIIGGEVKHDCSRRRPLARLWSSPGPATAG